MFSKKSKDTFNKAYDIIKEYQSAGHLVTLRQVYYQLVARNIIKNSPAQYHRLINIMAKARREGLCPMDSLIDRSRVYNKSYFFEDIKENLEHAAHTHRLDLWQGHKQRPVVLVEKQALESLVEQVCDKWRVDFMACKGYLSISALEEIRKQAEPGSVFLYLGDHDPSGLDMVRNLKMNLGSEVRHLALKIDQIQKLNLPHNTAKKSDNRYKGYRQKYGDTCWELDALPPDILQSYIERAILSFLDKDKYEEMREKENQDKEHILTTF